MIVELQQLPVTPHVPRYRKSCEQASQRRQRATELIHRSRGDPSLLPYYISRQWTSKFNTFAEPGAIDNWDFLCRHGGVRPDLRVPAEASCVRLPEAGWEYLHGSLGGGPVANALFECAVCREEWAALVARQRRELAEFRRLQATPAPPAAALSAAWYRRWEAFARGRETEPPGTIDNTTIQLSRAGTLQVRPATGLTATRAAPGKVTCSTGIVYRADTIRLAEFTLKHCSRMH